MWQFRCTLKWSIRTLLQSTELKCSRIPHTVSVTNDTGNWQNKLTKHCKQRRQRTGHIFFCCSYNCLRYSEGQPLKWWKLIFFYLSSLFSILANSLIMNHFKYHAVLLYFFWLYHIVKASFVFILFWLFWTIYPLFF